MMKIIVVFSFVIIIITIYFIAILLLREFDDMNLLYYIHNHSPTVSLPCVLGHRVVSIRWQQLLLTRKNSMLAAFVIISGIFPE